MAKGFAAAGFEVWVTDVDAGALTLPGRWHAHRADARTRQRLPAVRQSQMRADWMCYAPTRASQAQRRLIEDVALDDWRACVSGQPGRRVSGGQICSALDEGGGRRRDCHHLVDRWHLRLSQPRALCGGEMGDDRLDENLAMELGPFGIRANAICPGAVEGPRMEGVLAREAAAKGMTRDQVYDGYASGTSMRSFVTAQDVANMAVFLGSDLARLVSGQVIAVDGHTENPDPKI